MSQALRYLSLCVVGLALALVSGLVLPGCGGTTFVDDDGEPRGGRGGGGGMNGGSGGGAGTGGGGTGGGGTGGGGSVDVQAREVTNCEAWKTVGEVEEKLFKKKCSNGCHGRNSPDGDFTFMRGQSWGPGFVGKASTKGCAGEAVIDKESPEKSLLYRVLDASSSCSDAAGKKPSFMPPSGSLGEAEKACVLGYIKAVSAD